jgi:hypothetical protein
MREQSQAATTIILSAAADNDNTYPAIENDPKNPIHDPEEGGKVWTLPELMTKYGARRRS